MESRDLLLATCAFDPVSLCDMDSVRLMNRVETKYVFSARRLPDLLYMVAGNYRIFSSGSERIFDYHTTYLDTPDRIFYYQHLTGRLNRYKIRYRRYECSGDSYLEIKKKTNKNRTVKWRIENRLYGGIPDEQGSVFINEYLPGISDELAPVLINRFKRITLVGKITGERITLDSDINFLSPGGNSEKLPFIAVAEVKRAGHAFMSPFIAGARYMGIRPGGFSKYCIGSAMFGNMPRKNVLKPKFLLLNKIENEYNRAGIYN